MQTNQCRICGVVPSGETIAIFKGNGIYKDIAEKISSCLPIVINQDDLFPKIICLPCGTQVNNFFDLQEKSKETERLFKNSLKSISVFETSCLNIKREQLSPSCSPNQSPSHHTEDINPNQEHQEFVFCEPSMSMHAEASLETKSKASNHTINTSVASASNVGILPEMIEYDPTTTNKTNIEKYISNARNNKQVIYECAYCTLCFNSFEMSESHIKEMHYLERQERIKSKCLKQKTASKAIDSKLNSSNTLKKFTTKTMFRCMYCKLMFPTRDASANHILEAHKKELEERLALTKIKQSMKASTTNQSKSTDNNATVSNSGSKQNITLFRCKFCSLMFKSPEATQIHINEKHKMNNYKCEYCGTNFETNKELVNHKQSFCVAMLCKSQNNIQCDHCKTKYFSVKDVKQHILRCHLCTDCGKILTNGSYESMLQHKKDHVIASLKSEKCNICDAKFMHSSNLILHMQCHLKEQPFECNLCPSKYYTWQGLNKHLLTHPGKIIYECDFCNKAFARADYLQLHKRCHTSDKPFTCDVCDKCFPERYSLNKHRLVHDVNYLTCDKCGKVANSRSALLKHLKTHV